jgi:hypothetical protein
MQAGGVEAHACDQRARQAAKVDAQLRAGWADAPLWPEPPAAVLDIVEWLLRAKGVVWRKCFLML